MNKDKKRLLKALSQKWEDLINELGVVTGEMTLPYYDNGSDLQKAALEEIRRLKSKENSRVSVRP